MLLEVVVAVGLLVLGLAVIGAQLQSATEMTYEADHLSRLIFLAETRLAELDSGLVTLPEQMDDAQPIEVEADFGRYFPQYASRVTIEPTADPELVAVQLDILYDPERLAFEEGPLDEFDYLDDDKIVQTYHTLRIVPRPLNLVTDFGLEAEIAEKVNEDLQEAGLADGGLDVENFNPAVFKDLEVDQLLQLLSILQQAYGVDQSALMQMVPEEVRPQLQALLEGLDDGTDGDGDGDGDGVEGAGGGSGGAQDAAGGGRGGGRRGGADGGRAGREGRRGGRDAGREGPRRDRSDDGGFDDGGFDDGNNAGPADDEAAPTRRGGNRGGNRGGGRERRGR